MRLVFAVGLALLGVPAQAEVQKMKADGSVEDAMGRLEAAVEEAGATVFAKVNHAKGASDAGMQMADSQLLIFGNPQVGTPIMQQDMLAGLALPMEMLIYADQDGQTWVAYETPETMLEGLDVDMESEPVQKMTGALGKLSKAAAGGS